MAEECSEEKIGKYRRIESGIPGLDEMIEGGFPTASTILIAGEPGTGKTTFAVQSLFHGAKRGENAVYLTAISEPQWVVQRDLSRFTFYDQELVDRGKIVFIDIGGIVRKDVSSTLEVIRENVDRHQPNRLAFDPVSIIEISMKDKKTYREFLHDFTTFMKTLECVTFLVEEFSYSGIVNSVNAYVADALIMLSYPEEENVRKKYLEVLKMRGTDHLTGKHSVTITKDGFIVQPGLK